MPAKKAAKKAAAKPVQAPVAAEKPKKASKYPYKKLIVPAALQGVENGKLTIKHLTSIKTGGQMWVGCADKFNAMYDAAKDAGIKLRNIGDYRSFDSQFGLFQQRYSLQDLGRKPQVTRTYEGKTYYLRPGMSPCSTPGRSNHGLGLAIDLDVSFRKTLDWLCLNAPNFGFYLQSDDPSSPEFEAWHWQFCG